MNAEQQILAAVAEFRLYWNAITNIETSDFKGDWNDVLLLGYGVYEGFGAAPNSEDYFLESSVFALCLMKQVGFVAKKVCRQKNQIVLAPSDPYSGYSVNVMARVQDAVNRSYPQFEKYENLMAEVLAELLCGTTDPTPYRAVVDRFMLRKEIEVRCERTLRLLKEDEA
jgi:hypothetical protein